jgi:hypothetical protein
MYDIHVLKYSLKQQNSGSFVIFYSYLQIIKFRDAVLIHMKHGVAESNILNNGDKITSIQQSTQITSFHIMFSL